MRSYFLAIFKIAVLNKDHSFLCFFFSSCLLFFVCLFVSPVTVYVPKSGRFYKDFFFYICINFSSKVLKSKNTTLIFQLGRYKTVLYYSDSFILHHNII